MAATFFTTVLTAMAAMIVITSCWVAVQRLWRSQFPQDESGDVDTLANRSGCHGCNCAPASCQRQENNQTVLKEVSDNAP